MPTHQEVIPMQRHHSKPHTARKPIAKSGKTRGNPPSWVMLSRTILRQPPISAPSHRPDHELSGSVRVRDRHGTVGGNALAQRQTDQR